jgi:hypothetical protein
MSCSSDEARRLDRVIDVLPRALVPAAMVIGVVAAGAVVSTRFATWLVTERFALRELARVTPISSHPRFDAGHGAAADAERMSVKPRGAIAWTP